jgi:flagellar hook-associated protein 1
VTVGSTFGGLNVASTGLAAQRRAIEVAGHNVANANTPGYSRQRVDMGSITGGSSMIHTGTNVYGGGVSVLSQTRIVDSFLIGRSNTERSVQGTTTQLQQTYARIETAFNEPGELGLASQMDAYWDAWDAVASTPEDMAARAALLQRADAITGTFAQLTATFDLMTADSLQRGAAVVADVNGIAGQIAALNTAIVSAMDAGSPPNDMLDQRDELVRRLSSHIGVSVRTDERGQMDINVAGAALVSGSRTNTLSLDTTTPGAAVLRMSNTTVALSPRGGQLDGLLQTANTIIPQQQAALDAIAVRLRDTVNAQHNLHQDLSDPPVAAGDFFAGTGARDLALAPQLVGQPGRIGAAMMGDGRFGGGGARAMAELGGADSGPGPLYRAMIADLGVVAQGANGRAQLQDQLTMQVDRQRETVAGVSLDEEMANVIAYQQAYQASARYLTAVDEMLDVLINGTGRVGR